MSCVKPFLALGFLDDRVPRTRPGAIPFNARLPRSMATSALSSSSSSQSIMATFLDPAVRVLLVGMPRPVDETAGLRTLLRPPSPCAAWVSNQEAGPYFPVGPLAAPCVGACGRAAWIVPLFHGPIIMNKTLQCRNPTDGEHFVHAPRKRHTCRNSAWQRSTTARPNSSLRSSRCLRMNP